jgi:hypothetical protein
MKLSLSLALSFALLTRSAPTEELRVISTSDATKLMTQDQILDLVNKGQRFMDLTESDVNINNEVYPEPEFVGLNVYF